MEASLWTMVLFFLGEGLFETGSLPVAWADLELAMKTRLAEINLPSPAIKDNVLLYLGWPLFLSGLLKVPEKVLLDHWS